MRMKLDKQALLRDICSMVGIKVFARDYDLMGERIPPSAEPDYSHLPIQQRDIYCLFPIVKHLDIVNKDCRTYIQTGRSHM